MLRSSKGRVRFLYETATKVVKNPSIIIAKENIPIAGAFIGAMALSFQIGVLFPWHSVISQEVKELEENVNRLSAIASNLEQKINRVLDLEVEIKAKERRVLDKEDQILSNQNHILNQIHEMKQIKQ